MFEYHRWISLRSTYKALGDDPPLRLPEIKGVLTEHSDEFLSPITPVLEDSW
ncbi:hypothetical protein [Actinocrispum sp. NPDC049592]|uniref:hypothetical protein n=1 Tax=Actinocrispum sp. NPDC049592 TaxID=3154835 RepID=UPI0034247E5C